MAVAVERHLLDDDQAPVRLLSGARRHILSVVAVSWHLTRRHQEVPHCFCAGRGSQDIWPSPSPRISLATTKSPRGFCAGRGGVYTLGRCRRLTLRPSTRRSRAQLLRLARRPTPMAVPVARHLLGNNEVPARLLRRAQRPKFSCVAVAWHLDRRRQEVQPGLRAGRGWPTPMDTAVPRDIFGNNKVPARLLRGVCRPILSAVTAARHLARRRQGVPRGFCEGRDG